MHKVSENFLDTIVYTTSAKAENLMHSAIAQSAQHVQTKLDVRAAELAEVEVGVFEAVDADLVRRGSPIWAWNARP